MRHVNDACLLVGGERTRDSATQSKTRKLITSRHLGAAAAAVAVIAAASAIAVAAAVVAAALLQAGCADVTYYGAFIIGFVGGCLYVAASFGIRKAGIDDPLDAFAIHGACGAWGVFATGLFHTTSGAFYGGGGTLLGWQVVGIVVIAGWSALFSCLIFGLLSLCAGLRVTDDEEESGVDHHHHGGSAYAFNEVSPRSKAAKHEQTVLIAPESPSSAGDHTPPRSGVELVNFTKDEEEPAVNERSV
jgi:Amt family ammonium transporter